MDAGAPALLPGARPLAFVDVETTGGDPSIERITEIGIVRIDGDEIGGEWSTLVQPDRPIPPDIQRLTGITNEMVRDAPRFADIAEEIRLHTRDRLFLAHNSPFDAAFLRAEFRRLGQRFEPAQACTMQMSRRLHPHEARHGLDALIERHDLAGELRHRALGDARAIARFYLKMLGREGRSNVHAHLLALTRHPPLRPRIPEAQMQALPDAPGAFALFGEHGRVMHVEAARRMPDALRLLLTPGRGNALQHRLGTMLLRDALHLEWRGAAGELSAHLVARRWRMELERDGNPAPALPRRSRTPEQMQVSRWPNTGPLFIDEHDPHSGLRQYVRVDNWRLVDDTVLGEPEFDAQIYRLLKRRFARGLH